MKILLIEDNRGDVKLVETMLKEQKVIYQLNSVDTLAQALQLLAREKPTLILLDLILPDSYGLETFTQIQSIAAQTPIIVLTNNTDESIALAAVKKGAQDYLLKNNLASQVLVKAIRYAIKRKQAEELIRRYQSDVARVERTNSMGEIALTLAHELNQPLAAIVTYTQGCIRALQDQDFSRSEVIGIMEQAVRQAERASDILHRLKNFVYKGQLTYEIVDINQLIQATLPLLQPQIKAYTVDIEMDLANAQTHLRIDATQIQQVILNLLRNALESLASIECQNPKITIKTRVLPENKLEVHIIDNGPGFADPDIEKFFKPYVTTKSGGLGIGLAICRTIIEAHGGNFYTNPMQQAGAHLIFSLPIL